MKKDTNSLKMNTIIGKDSVVDGNFKAEGSTRIDGTVKGSVEIKGILILGSAGSIQGDVSADAAVIGGSVTGNILAPEKLEASSTARIIGDITTSVLVIDEKAIFQGGCNMNQDVSKMKKASGREVAKANKAGRKSAKEAIEEALKDVDEVETTQPVSAEENITE